MNPLWDSPRKLLPACEGPNCRPRLSSIRGAFLSRLARFARTGSRSVAQIRPTVIELNELIGMP